MSKSMDMRLLELCEELLPKTTQANNPVLKQYLVDKRKELEKNNG